MLVGGFHANSPAIDASKATPIGKLETLFEIPSAVRFEIRKVAIQKQWYAKEVWCTVRGKRYHMFLIPLREKLQHAAFVQRCNVCGSLLVAMRAPHCVHTMLKV